MRVASRGRKHCYKGAQGFHKGDVSGFRFVALLYTIPTNSFPVAVSLNDDSGIAYNKAIVSAHIS